MFENQNYVGSMFFILKQIIRNYTHQIIVVSVNLAIVIIMNLIFMLIKFITVISEHNNRSHDMCNNNHT